MSDSGVRADPPGNTIDDAAFAAWWDTTTGNMRTATLLARIELIRQAWVAGAAQAARDERQAIIDLAEQVHARYCLACATSDRDRRVEHPLSLNLRGSFADLLRGAETTGDNDEHE